MSLTISRTVARELAVTIYALKNCQASLGNAVTDENRAHWHKVIAMHRARIAQVMSGAPSGSGFDNGTQLDIERSSAELLVFETAYHHMTEHGFYDGWTEHTVKVRASLAFDLSLQVSGKNRGDIRDHIVETFQQWLSSVEL